MSTLKQIARTAGVSATTVSNVLNGNLSRVSAETAERVRSLIRQEDYVPNQAARSLAQRESRIICVIVQAHGEENIFLNPYNAAYVGALTVELYKNGYYPLIRSTDDFSHVENDIRGWNVAGAIFNGCYSSCLKQLRSLATVPCVLTDCHYQMPGASYVILDDVAGGYMAGAYLMEMGHRRIGFIANAVEESEVEQLRLEGLRQALAERGLSVPGEWVLPAWSLREAPERLEAVLNAPVSPTALFCASDHIALTLTRFLCARGLRVPEDVSVMGFDDLLFAELCTPQLTTIAQDVHEKARRVVEMLMAHIDDKALPPERAKLGVRLVERQSVAQLTTEEEV